MKTLLLLIFLSSSFSFFSQSDYEKKQQEFVSLAEKKDFLNVFKASSQWHQAYPDSLLPIISFFDFIFYNLEEIEDWEVDYLSEDDEEWYDELWELIDVLEEKHADNPSAQLIIAKYEFEFGELETSLSWFEKIILTNPNPEVLRIAIIVAAESDDTLIKQKILKIIEDNRNVSSDYLRSEVFANAVLGNYEKAFRLNFELIRKDENLYDYIFRAYMKYMTRDFSGACADMRMLKRKGANIDYEPWVYELNCNNEDRTPPEIKAFMAKHQPCRDTLSHPLVFNRKDFTPTKVKNLKLKSTDENLLNQPFTVVNFKYPERTYGFIYSRPKEGQTLEDVILRLFGMFSYNPKTYQHEIIYHEPLTAPLPNEFELCKPIYVMSIYGSLLEFKYVGMENYTLSSGQVISCAKIFVTTSYASEISNIAVYFFAKEYGWIARETMDGDLTTVEF